MDYKDLRKLATRNFFSTKDLAQILDIKPESARVLCSRYVKKSLFVRLKRNFYILEEKWRNLAVDEKLEIANSLQVPSYISFMTALARHEITTQVPRNFFESASLKRSARFAIDGNSFNYYKLKKGLYFDFIKKDNIFIATKEKAFVDSLYLYSFGKYKIDVDSLDIKKLDKAKLKKIVRVFPKKTRDVVGKICGI